MSLVVSWNGAVSAVDAVKTAQGERETATRKGQVETNHKSGVTLLSKKESDAEITR